MHITPYPMPPYEPPTDGTPFSQPDHTSLFPTLLRLDLKISDPENTMLENGKTHLYRYTNCAVSLRRDLNVVVREIERILELAPLSLAIPVVGAVFEGTMINASCQGYPFRSRHIRQTVVHVSNVLTRGTASATGNNSRRPEAQ
jgi:hypothetical protein